MRNRMDDPGKQTERGVGRDPRRVESKLEPGTVAGGVTMNSAR